MIEHQDQQIHNFVIQQGIYILTVLAAVIFVSEWLQRHKFFRYFSAALLVIIFTAILANIGMLPAGGHPVYSGIFDYIAPASIFVLLLDVNLGELRKVGLPMIFLFLLGTLATMLGVFTATRFIHDGPIFSGLYAPLAGMFAGTYTGGSLNFNAVALHYDVMENGLVFASAIAVDNIITAVWMFVTISIPVIFKQKRNIAHPSANSAGEEQQDSERVGLKDLSVLILLTFFGLWFSEWLTLELASIGITVPSILIITTIALILAQFKPVSRLPGTRVIGSWLIYLFLAVIGAFCDLSALYNAGELAMVLFLYVTVIIAVHGVCLFLAGRFIFKDWDLVAIASQANIGGSTTAMALAQNFNRHELVLPAIIIGSLGNALGTYVGFFMASVI
ncbi:MAG: DUF819 family protein [Cyclobacteriaceae bacterium]